MPLKTFPAVVNRISQGFVSDSGPTKEFSSFATQFRNLLKKELAAHGATLADFNRGHFYLSGFYEKDGRFGYFSISDVRHGINSGKLMFRTAKDKRDYTGGSNQWVDMTRDDVAEQMMRVFA